MSKRRTKNKARKAARAKNKALADFDRQMKAIEAMPDGPAKDKAFDELGQALGAKKAEQAHRRSKKGQAEDKQLKAAHAVAAEIKKKGLNKRTTRLDAETVRDIVKRGRAGEDLADEELDILRKIANKRRAIASIKDKHGFDLSAADQTAMARDAANQADVEFAKKDPRILTPPIKYKPHRTDGGQGFVTKSDQIVPESTMAPFEGREVPEERRRISVDRVGDDDFDVPPVYKIIADPAPGETIHESLNLGTTLAHQTREGQNLEVKRDLGAAARGAVQVPVKLGAMLGGAAAETWLTVTGESDKVGEAQVKAIGRQERSIDRYSTLQRVQNDAADIVEGTWKFATDLVSDDGKPMQDNIDRYSVNGGHMLANVVGEMGALMDNPARALQANPLAATMNLLPWTKAAANGAKIIAGTRMASRQMQRLAHIHERFVKPGMEQIRRLCHSDPFVKAMIDEAFLVPAKLSDEIISMGNRLQNSAINGTDAQYARLLDDIKEALPNDEAMAAYMGKAAEAAKKAEPSFDHVTDYMNLRPTTTPGGDIDYGGVQPPQRAPSRALKRQIFVQVPSEIPGQPWGRTFTQSEWRMDMDVRNRVDRASVGAATGGRGKHVEGAGWDPIQARQFEVDPRRPTLEEHEVVKRVQASGKELFGYAREIELRAIARGEKMERPTWADPRHPEDIAKADAAAAAKAAEPEAPKPKDGENHEVEMTATEQLKYSTDIPKLDLPPTKWGMSESIESLVKALEDPNKVWDRVKTAEQISLQAGTELRHNKWPKIRATLEEWSRRHPHPWLSVDLSQDARKYLGENAPMPGSSAKMHGADPQVVEMAKALEESIVVPRAFDMAMTTKAWMEDKHLHAGKHPIYALHKSIKAAQTSFNISSGIGNWVSNIVMQSMHWGENPMLLVRDSLAINSQHKKWMLGEKVDPQFEHYFRLGEKEGLILSNALTDAELGASTMLLNDDWRAAVAGGALKGAVIGGVMGAVVGGAAGPLFQKLMNHTPANKILKWQQDFYAFGDNAMKLDHGWRFYQTTMKDISHLADGQYLTLKHSKKGLQKIERMPNKQWAVNGQMVDPYVVKETVMGSGIQGALDRMFDYRDTGVVVDWVRTAPIMALATPFPTWAWKSLDIPGIKKGLIYRTMEMPGMGTTNSPRLAAMKLAKDVVIGQRRSVVINSMRNDLAENRHETRRFLSFSPSQPRMHVMRMTTNPLWIESDDIEQYNFMQTGLHLLRFADGIINQAPSVEDLSDYSRWTEHLDDLKGSGLIPPHVEDLQHKYNQKMIQMARSRPTAGDVAQMFLLSGSMMGEAMNMINDQQATNKNLNKQKLYNSVSVAVLGGGVSKLWKIGMGLVSEPGTDPYLLSGLPERDSQLKEVQEDLIKFYWRSITGMGSKVQWIGEKGQNDHVDDNLKPRNYYSSGIQRNTQILKSAMFGTIQKKIDSLQNQPNKTDADMAKIARMQQMIVDGNRVIDAEQERHLRMMKVHWTDWEIAEQAKKDRENVKRY